MGSEVFWWYVNWSWMDQLYPYVKNLSCYICPSGPKGKIENNGGTVNGIPGYGINDCIIADNTAYSLSTIQKPSQLVFIGDAPYVVADSASHGVQQTLMNIGPFAYSVVNGADYNKVNGMAFVDPTNKGLKHNGGANFTFADGHAKYYKKNQGPCYYNSSNPQFWDRGKNAFYWDPTNQQYGEN